MAYSKAAGRAAAKYTREHYKQCSIKIPLDVWEKLQECKRFTNINQLVNVLLREEIERDQGRDRIG